MGDPPRLSRWYFGGLASAGAACCTHPLDLLKVHLQTQQGGKISIVGQTVKVVKSEGILGLYAGLSASLLRQLTYSTTRFAIYNVAKQQIAPDGGDVSFGKRVVMAAAGGAAGGLVGTPGDMVNVRMQNDVKLPKEQRRNYKHAIDGLARIFKEEGGKSLIRGWEWATPRAMLMTIGQLSFYDSIKSILLESGYFADNLILHFTASTCAGAIATTMTQPLDVLKTRAMNAAPGEFSGPLDLIKYTAKAGGPLAFYKGYIPAFTRLGPHTIFTFVFFEQLRQNFGYFPDKS